MLRCFTDGGCRKLQIDYLEDDASGSSSFAWKSSADRRSYAGVDRCVRFRRYRLSFMSGLRRYRSQLTFRRHVRAHLAVINNEIWYGDALPSPGESFSAARTNERHREVIEILLRAHDRALRTGDRKLASAYIGLADKMSSCRSRRRCGSLACTKCARAFQKAKVDAQHKMINDLSDVKARKHLVLVTVVPTGKTYTPGQFSLINIQKANRWLKDALTREGFKRVMLGSVDLGWESRRGGNYIQIHWHLAMWTSNSKNIANTLKVIIPRTRPYERSVDVTEIRKEGFLPYINKVIKLPDLLRRNRKHLPELLLALDRTEPLDALFLSKVRVSAQDGGITLQQIKS